MQKAFTLFNVIMVIFLVSLFSACSSSRQATTQIGLLPLEAYSYTGQLPTTDPIYRVIRSEDVFTSTFHTNDAAARKPAFNGQTVVAIVIKTPLTPFRFISATVSNQTIHVYAQTCSNGGCVNTGAVLATVPNVGNARVVRFYINGESKAQVKL